MQTLERNEIEVLASPSISKADYKQLVKRLKIVEKRRRLQEAMRLIPYALVIAGGISLAIAIYSRIFPSFTLEKVALFAATVTLAALVGVLLYAFARPRQLMKTAVEADVLLGLKSQFTTAIEGYNNPKMPGYAELGERQFRQAMNVTAGLKPHKIMPLSMDRRPALAALVLIPLVILALVIPNPLSEQIKQNEVIKQQIEQQAQKIEDLKQQIERQNPEAAKNDPKTQELLKQLEQVKKDLLEKSANKEEALAAIAKAQEDIQKLTNSNQATAEKAALESLARTFNSSDVTKPAGQALQQTSPERYENAAKELEKLANDPKALEQLKTDLGQSQQLSDKLAKDAQNFKNSNPQMAQQLQQLSDALKPQNMQQNQQAAQQSLRDVAQQLRQSGKNQQLNDQVQQAQSQLQNSEESINAADQPPGQKGQQSGQQPQPGTENGENTGMGQQIEDAGDGQQTDSGTQPQSGQKGQQPGQQGQQPGQQGQQSGQQPGQQGQQPGQQPGQQSGQQGQQPGQQPGQQAGNDQGQGQGPGNKDGQNGNQGNQGNQDGQGSKAGKGSSDNVYTNPTQRRQDGSQVNLSGKEGQGPSSNQNVQGGNPSGQANIPYQQVLDSYSQQAAQQLDKNYVPITLKDMVKQYFDDLNKKDK